MRVLLLYIHRRRTIAHYFRRAFLHRGWDVVTCGPWMDEMYGWRGTEPDVRLQDPAIDRSRHDGRWHYYWDQEIAPFLPTTDFDARILLDDGGGRLQIDGIPNPWLHHAIEGTGLHWSNTPYKSAALMCNVTNPAGITYIPSGYDVEWHTAPDLTEPREYDFTHIATPRASRLRMWQLLMQRSDIKPVLGEIWGSLYNEAYKHSTCTLSCATANFVTMRVWESMAMGCILLSDELPAVREFFDESQVLFFNSVPATPDGERMPDPLWLADTIRRLRDNLAEARRIREAAYEAVRPHSWLERTKAMTRLLGIG